MRAVRLRRPGGLRCYHVVMALDERAFFNEKPETRPGSYQCPKCRRTSEYGIRWMRRTKKNQPPPGATDADKAKFTKLRDYLLRLDDVVTCKSCGRKFDIPSQHSLVYVDQLAGLPDPDELEREIRVTVLHELAHYFGIDEDRIAELGYQ